MPASEPAQPVHEGRVYTRTHETAGGTCDRCKVAIPRGQCFNATHGFGRAESRLCLPCGWVLALEAEAAR